MRMPTKIAIPSDGINRMSEPRASYRMVMSCIDVNVWCIEDVMSKEVGGSNLASDY